MTKKVGIEYAIASDANERYKPITKTDNAPKPSSDQQKNITGDSAKENLAKLMKQAVDVSKKEAPKVDQGQIVQTSPEPKKADKAQIQETKDHQTQQYQVAKDNANKLKDLFNKVANKAEAQEASKSLASNIHEGAEQIHTNNEPILNQQANLKSAATTTKQTAAPVQQNIATSKSTASKKEEKQPEKGEQKNAPQQMASNNAKVTEQVAANAAQATIQGGIKSEKSTDTGEEVADKVESEKDGADDESSLETSPYLAAKNAGHSLQKLFNEGGGSGSHGDERKSLEIEADRIDTPKVAANDVGLEFYNADEKVQEVKTNAAKFKLDVEQLKDVKVTLDQIANWKPDLGLSKRIVQETKEEIALAKGKLQEAKDYLEWKMRTDRNGPSGHGWVV